MEEIKVGDYIRTKNGIIAKCIREQHDRYVFNKIILEEGYYIDYIFKDISKLPEYILKHSPNIIDLIEEGDYIQLEDRGERFYAVTTDYQGKLAIIDIGWNEYEEIDETYNQDIKSIVTKEQFNAIEYKVEE